MPALSTIAAIAAIASAGVGAGSGIYSAVNSPSSPKLPTGVQPQTAATNQAQTAAVTSSLPTLQSLTGGSLSPEYAAAYGATQAGLGNNPQASGNVQQAINQYFGLSSPGTTAFTPEGVGSGGGTNILDLLRKTATPGGAGSPFGGGGSDDFKGLSA